MQASVQNTQKSDNRNQRLNGHQLHMTARELTRGVVCTAVMQ